MVTSKNPFRRLPAEFPPDCVNPPCNAESIASSAFLARQKFCSESVQNRFLEVTIGYRYMNKSSLFYLIFKLMI